MPPVLAERLAWATEYRRKCYLFPNCPESWERQTADSMSDGYAQEHCRSMLAALAALGIRLQEGPQACALLAAEQCRQREKASLPPEPTATQKLSLRESVYLPPVAAGRAVRRGVPLFAAPVGPQGRSGRRRSPMNGPPTPLVPCGLPGQRRDAVTQSEKGMTAKPQNA